MALSIQLVVMYTVMLALMTASAAPQGYYNPNPNGFNFGGFNFGLDTQGTPYGPGRTGVNVGIPGLFNVHAGGGKDPFGGGGGGTDVRVLDNFGVYATGQGDGRGGGGSNVRIGNPNNPPWPDFGSFLNQYGGRR